MLFIGIDLAWSDRNGSGFCVIEGNRRKGKVLMSQVLGSDNEIIAGVKEWAKNGKAFIAIDAPLVVPNVSGRRRADHEISMAFRKYHAGAYPANRQRLSLWSGKIRGEEISKKLSKIGFKQSPYIKRFEASRKFFEVYPHPSIVALFGLDRILQYKSKPKRDYEYRWYEFEKYQKYLKNLRLALPALEIPREITQKDVRKLKGKALKDYEDILDSILCAYIAYYVWVNPDKCKIFGDLKNGYIITPVRR